MNFLSFEVEREVCVIECEFVCLCLCVLVCVCEWECLCTLSSKALIGSLLDSQALWEREWKRKRERKREKERERERKRGRHIPFQSPFHKSTITSWNSSALAGRAGTLPVVLAALPVCRGATSLSLLPWRDAPVSSIGQTIYVWCFDMSGIPLDTE